MSSDKKSFFVWEYSLWDKAHFRILKGLAIAMVLAAYLLETVFQFSAARFLIGTASAVFLFCSGYGLSESFQNKQGLPHFWENKIVKIWLPSLVVVCVTAMVQEAGNSLGWMGENPLALSGWFLYLLIAEYAIFWLVFRLQKGTWQKMLWFFLSAAVLFFMVPHSQIIGQVLAFPVGVAASTWKWRRPLRNAPGLKAMLLCEVLLISGGGLCLLAGILQTGMAASALYALAYPALAVLLGLFTYYLRKLRIFGLFAPLGTISYALYLLHSPILSLLEKAPSWRASVLIFVLLLLAAAAYSRLMGVVVRWNKRMRKTKIHIKGRIG